MRIADSFNKTVDASAILKPVRRKRPRRFRIDFLLNRDKIPLDVTLFQRFNGRWYARFTLNGKRYMVSTGETDETRALLKLGKIVENSTA